MVGGDPIGETIEGRERYPIVLRYPRNERGSSAALAQLPLIAPAACSSPWDRWPRSR